MHLLSLLRPFLLIILAAPVLQAQDFSTYEWEIYDTTNSILTSQFIVDILAHPNGSVYVTTGNLGFFEFRGDEIKEIKPTIPVNHWLMRMELDLQNRIYFAGNQGQLVIYDPATNIWEKRDFPVQALYLERNHKGTFLITTHIGSEVQLYQLKGDELTPIEQKREDALGLYIADNGDAYVGFRDGAYRYPMDEQGTYTLKPEKIADLGCYGFGIDSRNHLWAASYSTLNLHERIGENWKEYIDGPKELYYDWNGTNTYVIHHMDILPDDRILISTQAKGGLGVWNGRTWEGYPIPHIPFNGTGRFIVAPDYSIWMATANSGLAIFRPTEPVEPEPMPAPEPIVLVPDGDTANYLPDQGRTVYTQSIVKVSTAKVVIEVKDHQQVDNDTISLYLNGERILSKFGITKSFHSIPITLQPGTNELLLFAENVGTIPPNTIFLRIEELGMYQGFFLNSDLARCERLLIEYEIDK